MQQFCAFLSACALLAFASFGHAQTTTQTQPQARERTEVQSTQQTQDRIYGSEMMTPGEREAHRQRLQNAATEQEREQIRAQHHRQMEERARERGQTLPAEPEGQKHKQGTKRAAPPDDFSRGPGPGSGGHGGGKR